VHHPPRILCVNGSRLRLPQLARTLRKAGFEVWTAQGASDAVCLASGLKFDALVVDEETSYQRAAVWRCLAEAQPSLPVLVHASRSRVIDLCAERATGEHALNPEVVLAMLVLLFGRSWAQPAQRGSAA
jgi:hypothetical protein